MKKIYLEITNNCNLNCSFCIKNSRKNKFMSKEEFRIVLDKVKPYTNYLYFHLLGEPFMHPEINYFIDFAHNNNFFVNITTNGYLINKLKTDNIRQINISLHSYSPMYNVSTEDYLANIFKVLDKLNNTYVSYRFWAHNKYSEELLSIINNHYNTNFEITSLKKSNKISDKIFINTSSEFVWPDKNNDFTKNEGVCYALRDHIGILVDGTVVPCCLDSKGDINLGNIFSDDLNIILNSNRACKMLEGFRNKKRVEELCKKCNFTSLDD